MNAPSDRPNRPRLLARGSWPEATRIATILRAETTGGLLLIVATLAALVWANSPAADSYEALRELRIGPGGTLHLDLTLAAWAADGLLAIFFFVVGLELKREFVAGDLRDPRRAALPIAAAVGGMVVPALVYVAWNASSGGLGGWAIPTATDIAFALAVLAVVSTHLPFALRTFLLTLAVVDDLLAVTVIALFYTDSLEPLWLLAALLPLAAFALAVRSGDHSPLVLVPLAVVTWTLVHESGVHATVAGVALGFTVPVLARAPEETGLAERLEHAVRPVSAGIAVPLFAFFAAGVSVGGLSGFVDALRDPVAVGIVTGLIVGKAVGITGATWLLARFTRAELDDELAWSDILGMALLAGIGFTVSLLIGDLAFGAGSEQADHVKVAVLAGSVLAAVLASVVLRSRNRAYRRISERESRDLDQDGVPDAFQEQQRSDTDD